MGQSVSTVRSAILLVGGFGTRMQPLTFHTPKPMLPLLGKPITEHQIMKAKAAGITEIVLATSFLSDVFTPYFGDGEKFGIKIKYAVEESALGTGGAMRNAANYLSESGAVLIFNGDVLSEHSLQKQIELHQNLESDVSLHLTEVDDARAFGVVEMNGESITSFNEKMENPPTKIINAGCYIFNREIIDEIPEDKVVSVEREVFPGLLARGAKVTGYVDGSYWLDIGNPGALLRATAHLVTQRGEVASIEGAQIDPTATIGGGSYIGKGASVGSGSHIMHCVIESGASIGENCLLEECFVAAGQVIPSGTTLKASFFGYQP